jgi:quinol monooxygenase YgiN
VIFTHVRQARSTLEVPTLMNTPEVVVLVQLRVQVEHRANLLQMLLGIIERSRIAPECLSYELFNRANDENILLLFQTWGTREAFEANWKYIDAAKLNANSDMLAGPMESWELQLLL